MSATISGSDSESAAAVDGFAVVAFLLRWRRLIVAAMLLGLVVGGLSGLLRHRVYRARAVFIPQASENSLSSSGLALAASQFDIQLPGLGRGQWGSAVYVSLLTSDALLTRVAGDSVRVDTTGGALVALPDLLRVPSGPDHLRRAQTVRRLRNLMAVRDLKAMGGVEVVFVTRWPQVSAALAERLLSEVQQFVKVSRQSQASAEREFAERRVVEEQRLLDASETRFRAFLEANRSVQGSPELTFERDRLQRDVALRQQIYASMVQAREEARLREVRDTPVITVLELPELPLIPESRRTPLRGAVGVMMGATLAVLIGLFLDAIRLAAESTNPNAQSVAQFFRRVVSVVAQRRSA